MSAKVAELSTRQMRAEIRAITKNLNAQLSEYLSGDRTGKGDIAYQSLIEASGVRTRKGGLLGTGLENKTKGELQRQLSALRRWDKTDIFKGGSGDFDSEASFETAKNRYGITDKAEFELFAQTMSLLKDELHGYGYEGKKGGKSGHGKGSLSGTYAKMYKSMPKDDRSKFIDYIRQAKKDMDTGVNKRGEPVQITHTPKGLADYTRKLIESEIKTKR